MKVQWFFCYIYYFTLIKLFELHINNNRESLFQESRYYLIIMKRHTSSSALPPTMITIIEFNGNLIQKAKLIKCIELVFSRCQFLIMWNCNRTSNCCQCRMESHKIKNHINRNSVDNRSTHKANLSNQKLTVHKGMHWFVMCSDNHIGAKVSFTVITRNRTSSLLFEHDHQCIRHEIVIIFFFMIELRIVFMKIIRRLNITTSKLVCRSHFLLNDPQQQQQLW